MRFKHGLGAQNRAKREPYVESQFSNGIARRFRRGAKIKICETDAGLQGNAWRMFPGECMDQSAGRILLDWCKNP